MINKLSTMWKENKAKGLLAEAVFSSEVDAGRFGADATKKLVQGCWILASKGNANKFRFAFFTHPDCLDVTTREIDLPGILGDKYRPLCATCEYLLYSGMGSLYVLPTTEGGSLPLDEITERDYTGIQWRLFSFGAGDFREISPEHFFRSWGGGRGRPTYNNSGWSSELRSKYEEVPENTLTAMLLNELFFTGYLKSELRVSPADPYDIDSFFISLSQRHIYPVEIKEKSPAESGGEKFFGLDAGRILMLLRLSLANDSNALYLIRELSDSRIFTGWKYMTLCDLIMTAGWNLQGGGAGMGGQSTQTVRLPYSEFGNFTVANMSEEWLREHTELSKDARCMASAFYTELENRFLS